MARPLPSNITTTRPKALIGDRATDAPAPLAIPGYVYGLSIALAIIAALSGVLTYVFGGELTGPPVMNGSARGTALVLFALGVPVLALAMLFAARGSVRAVFVWFGTALYIGYNSFLLLLGTPMNRFFLVYETALALSIAVAAGVAVAAGPRRLARQCSPELPARGLAVYLWALVALNALAWLARIVPATIDDDTARLVAGTGITMFPTYLQDLAFWLPLSAVGATWLWRRLPWGYVLAGGALVMGVIEAITVATDQWFGHRADPTSDVASGAAVIPFAVAAVIAAGAAWLFLRHVRRQTIHELEADIDLR